MHLQDAVYVLSYKGYAWPDGHQYDGILGVYARLANAKTAGTRWLGEQAGLHADGFDSASAAATYVRGWEGDEAGGVWEKAKADNGTVFLESRALRIEKCDVRMDGSFVAGGA